jgi:2-polyprenyl-3-methyl-5-hydroxy-6-metoxy-1,4-benzoquinol methylase
LLDAHLSAEQIETLYTRYYPRSGFDVDAWSPPKEASGWDTWWRGLRASAFRWVPREVRVLDIGCGFGESLGFHAARGCDAYGVEADANILRVAERHGLKVRHGLFDPDLYERCTFDVVTLDQVIEHVADPVTVLRGIDQVLKPGGRLILSTPNANGWGARVFGQRWIHWHAPYHLQFFSESSLQGAATKAGLVVERRQTITQSAWLDFQFCHLVTYPSAGEPSVFWSPGARRTKLQRLALRLARLPQQLGVNVLLTRMMDALGLGDNSVYVLRKPTA